MTASTYASDAMPPLRSEPYAPAALGSGLLRRVSWGAVMAGAVTALAVQVLLAMLGTGLGASTIDPTSGSGTPSASSLGVGAAIWWGVSSLLSLAVGGYVAGRLSGVARPGEGGLHGLLTWAVAVLATVYLVGSTAGALMRGAGGVLSTAATVAASGVAAAAPSVAGMAGDQLKESGLSFDDIKREAMSILRQTGKPALQPGEVEKDARNAASQARDTAAAPTEQDLSSLLERLLQQGKEAASQVDRDAVINVVVARTGVTREEATRRVAAWEDTADKARAKAAQAAEEAKVKAREAADASAKAVSQAMLAGFAALAIGGLAAWLAGAAGQRRGAKAALV